MRIFIQSVFLIFLMSCSKSSEVAKQVQLTGMNGPAYYTFSRDNKDIISVFKIDYLKHICCDVYINRDTVIIGDEFIASIVVHKPNYRVVIAEPITETISGSFTPGAGVQKADNFLFIPTKPGLHYFRCNVEYDSISIPFEYKFLVLPK